MERFPQLLNGFNMPYSAEHNVLFIHIPKNAGRSIEAALDLISLKYFARLESRSGFRSTSNRLFTMLQRMTSNRHVAQTLHGTLDVALCAQHVTLQEILLLNLIDKDTLKGMKRFAVFRNPYDRAISSFFHFTDRKSATRKNFESFCRNWYEEASSDHSVLAHRRQQIDFILDTRGRVGVNRILRFENLSRDFADLCREWGISSTGIPHVGKSPREASKELHSPATKKLISHQFKDDLEFCESKTVFEYASAPL